MSTYSENTFFDSILEYGKKIHEMIQQNKKDGNIVPEQEPIIKWEVKDFRYTENGVETGSEEGKYDTKATWFLSAYAINKKLEESVEFQNLNSYLKKIFPNNDNITLRDYTDRLVHGSLQNVKFNFDEIKKLTNNFLSELKGNLPRSVAEVHLEGVIIEPKRIDLGNGKTIRQPKIDDLTKESTLFGGNLEQHHFPSAILEIEFFGDNPRNLQDEVFKSITILRLFKVGTVKYITYRFHSDSFRPMFGGTFGTLNLVGPVEKCFITNSEVKKLSNFWSYIEDVVYKKLTHGDEGLNFMDIACKRYDDALTQNGTIERRISSTIMGLESIFLRDGGETQELSYRLKLRVAKLLTNFNLNPLEVAECIEDAYSVRSQFVHGSLLSYQKKKKLVKKYGDVKNLLIITLDYLRIALVHSLLMNITKDEFIDILNDSFIDEKAMERLHVISSNAKSILCFTPA